MKYLKYFITWFLGICAKSRLSISALRHDDSKCEYVGSYFTSTLSSASNCSPTATPVFPCNLVNYLRKKCKSSPDFALVVESFFSRLRLNPILFLEDEISELSIERWRKNRTENESLANVRSYHILDLSEETSLSEPSSSKEAAIQTSVQKLKEACQDKKIEADTLLMQISYVQDCIERAIGVPTDVWDQDVQHTNESSRLKKQLFSLRNELLYERYINQLNVRKFALQKMSKIVDTCTLASHSSFPATLERKDTELNELRRIFSRFHQKAHSWKSSLKQHTKLQCERIKELTQENADLQAVKQAFYLECAEKTKLLDSNRIRTSHLTAELLNAKMNLETLSSRLIQQEDYRSKIATLDAELLRYEQKHRTDRNLASQILDLTASLKQSEEINSGFEKQLQITEDRNLNLQRRLTKCTLEKQILEEQMCELKHCVEVQKSLFEEQKHVKRVEIEAIESKYRQVKEINVALQRKIMDIQNVHAQKQK